MTDNCLVNSTAYLPLVRIEIFETYLDPNDMN